MQRITFSQPHPLHDTEATRALEAHGIAQSGSHGLMQRAGAAVAKLAQAIAPHAQTIWIAAGAGNNGGDGLEAAALLQQAGRNVLVSWLGTPDKVPPDSRLSWQRAQDAGVQFTEQPPARLGAQDLCIDALLGIGLSATQVNRTPGNALLQLLNAVRETQAITLHVDIPSGLIADTGQLAPGFERRSAAVGERHTLSLLTLHPGLFTGSGRDEAGQIWLDDLQVPSRHAPPAAWLAGEPRATHRPHASHKGSWGDVAVIGGEGLAQRGMGMTGAAMLAASAALYAGAGRVMLAALDEALTLVPFTQPELMLRRWEVLDLENITTVCGCGGGLAIAPVLPTVLQRAQRLVLDADALNLIASDEELQTLVRQRASSSNPPQLTVMTPHPLEAARLLGCSSADVQADRLQAAAALAQRYVCTVVLKGSGSIVATPGLTPSINPTGNARLGTGGTGDVLAGLLGARIAAIRNESETHWQQATQEATIRACWEHGFAADQWPANAAFSALELAKAL